MRPILTTAKGVELRTYSCSLHFCIGKRGWTGGAAVDSSAALHNLYPGTGNHTTRAQDSQGGDRETHSLYLQLYYHTTKAQDPQRGDPETRSLYLKPYNYTTIQPGIKIHRVENVILIHWPLAIQPYNHTTKAQDPQGGDRELLIHYLFSHTSIQAWLKIHKGETEKLIYYTFSHTTIQPGLKIHKGETEKLIYYTFSYTTIQPGLKIH
jgi:hypothetical protein